ncbi:MAG: hypothetical protein GTO17_06285 [Candidatus Aminicenantes bacterium]|nr:hypothetical protein [Candidatus Aminicenantes bacterium]
MAKKEKEKKAALRAKGKKRTVITNAVLAKRKGLPKVSVEPSDSSPPSSAQSGQDTMSSTSVMATEESKFASGILLSPELVENPEFALRKPDGQFAEISIMGFLDLEISAKNGPGDDIAIYARLKGAEEVMRGGVEEGGATEAIGYQYWEGFWYGVLGMNESGDWEAIGRGTGMSSPEKFDLGSLSSIKGIRIMFRPHNDFTLGFKPFRFQPEEFTFGIDGVEALH